MSQAYAAESDAPEVEETDVETPEAAEDEAGQADDDGEGEGQPKAQDWEKLAHNREGQAARERSRRRAAERRATELESRLERLETQTRGGDADELLELIASLREDEDDPVGDIAGIKKALKTFRARQLAEHEETQAQTVVQRQVEALRTSMADAEADFATDHPDYHEAAAFYRKARVEELEDAGYTGRNLDRKLADDLFGVVRMALEGGQDPAERVYALAKRRGFKTGAGAMEKKLSAIQRASESGVRPQGKGAAPGVLSWDDVAKLDGAARDKAWAKLRERERARK
jgi:hypothetical protein